MADEAWTSGIPFQGSAFADVILGPVSGNSFLALASQPLAGRSAEEWTTEIAESPDWGDTCTPATEPVTVDGSLGSVVTHCDGTLSALVTEGGRGYLIVLYGIDDPSSLFAEIIATAQLDSERALSRYASDFQLPFYYVLPTGAEFDYGTTNATWFEIRVPAFADAGHPGGVILQMIQSGLEDPCDGLSKTVPIEAGAQAVIDYLKTIPQIELTDETAVAVGELPAVQATVTATTTTACPEVWPFLERTEPIPGDMPLRIVAFDVGDQHLVFTVFGEADNTGFTAMADSYIDSIRFK